MTGPEQYANRLGLVAQEATFGPGSHPSPAEVRDNPRVEELRRVLRSSFAKEVERGRDPSEVFVQLRDEVVPGWSSTLLATSPEEAQKGEARSLFALVRNNLVGAYEFDEGWHAELLALFVIQSAIASALPRVWHVYLSGPPGAGKTGLGKRVVDLCDGRMLGDASTAVLGRSCAYGRVIGIDESDIARGGEEATAARDGLVRDAYRADAPKYERIGKQSGKVDSFDVFGPRLLISREDLDTATATRGIPVGCAKSTPNEQTYSKTYEKLLESVWPSGVQDLAARIKRWAESRLKGIGAGELRKLAASEAFRERVAVLSGARGPSREAELALSMLLTIELSGLSYDSLAPSLRRALSAGRTASATGDDQAAIDAMQALRAILGRPSLEGEWDHTSKVRVRRKEWLDGFNCLRSERHEVTLGSKKFGSVLRDIGVRESWRVDTGNVASFDLPQHAIEAAFGGRGRFLEDPNPQVDPRGTPSTPLAPLPLTKNPELGNRGGTPLGGEDSGARGASGASGLVSPDPEDLTGSSLGRDRVSRVRAAIGGKDSE